MSAVTDLVVARVKTNEGFSAMKYVDTRGNESIGYGFNITAGISRYVAEALLEAQLSESETYCQGEPWYQAADSVRQGVLCELCFNMGLAKLLGFPRMLSACIVQDWTSAGAELKNSAWFTEVGERGPELVSLLTNGG